MKEIAQAVCVNLAWISKWFFDVNPTGTFGSNIISLENKRDCLEVSGEIADRKDLMSMSGRKFQKFPEGRQALFLILLQAGNDGTRRFLESRLEDESFGTSSEDLGEALGKTSLGFAAPLERTINTGGDLDLLRFEFLATGHREPIIRIIDVLEWPDRIRSLLETWLKLKNPSGFERRAAIHTLWDRGSILCDEETDELVSAQDIDLHCAMEGMNMSKERFHKFRELLPLRFVGDMNVLQVKAEAKWLLHRMPGSTRWCSRQLKSKPRREKENAALRFLRWLPSSNFPKD